MIVVEYDAFEDKWLVTWPNSDHIDRFSSKHEAAEFALKHAHGTAVSIRDYRNVK